MIACLVAFLAIQSEVTIDRGEYVIHADTIGSGVPMVAIPGGPGFAGKSVWGVGFGCRSNIKTYLFDQLGTGKSQPKKVDHNLKQFISISKTVDDLEALRKAEKHDKWIVFGQSWGAIVALVYASRHPERVQHLVLTSIPGIGHDGTILGENLNKAIPEDISNALLKIEIDSELTEEQKIGRQILIMMPYYFCSPSIGESYLKLVPPDLFNPNVFTALQKNIRNTEAYYDDLENLKKSKFPVTLIQGHQDPCGAAMPYILKEKFLPQANVSMIGSAGHFAWLENRITFFTYLYNGLNIDPPPYIKNWDGFGDDPDNQKEDEERKRLGWPFNYVPPQSG